MLIKILKMWNIFYFFNTCCYKFWTSKKSIEILRKGFQLVYFNKICFCCHLKRCLVRWRRLYTKKVRFSNLPRDMRERKYCARQIHERSSQIDSSSLRNVVFLIDQYQCTLCFYICFTVRICVDLIFTTYTGSRVFSTRKNNNWWWI